MTDHFPAGFADALFGGQGSTQPGLPQSVAAAQVLQFFDAATRDLTTAQLLPEERALAIVLALLSEALAAARFKSSLTALISHAGTDTLAHARVLQDLRLRALSETLPETWCFVRPPTNPKF